MTQFDLPTLASILCLDLITAIYVICHYALFGYIVYRVPFQRRDIALGVLLFLIMHGLTRYFLASMLPGYIITLLMFFFISKLLWPTLRGRSYWLCFVLCVLSEFISELLATFGGIHFLNPRVILVNHSQVFVFEPIYKMICVAAIYFLVLSVCALVLKTVVRIIRKEKYVRAERRYIVYMVALSLLVLIHIILFSYTSYQLFQSSASSASIINVFRQNLPFILSGLILVSLLIFYLWQSIQQYRLYVNNQSLEARNEAYQRVLTSMREFRHNVSNMIYGFEGVIMTGDVESIQKYYKELARRCLLTNNENAVALNNIRDGALVSLLLRKMDLSTEKEIPLYLNVEPGFTFDGLPSVCLVEALGNLLDNAIEAASTSEAPRVNVWMSKTQKYSEIILSNTYSGQSNLSFLTGDAVSSKPEHQATGLSSVRRILAKYPEVNFNQYVQGRYIETSLSINA